MKRLRAISFLLSSLLLIGASIACGDDETDTGSPTSAPATQDRTDETPGATADDGGSPTGGLDDEVQVKAAEFSFDPANFAVPAGVPVKIEVRNTGAVMHTLTVYADADYITLVEGADTDNIEAGEDANIETTFDSGQYFFRCDIHPSRMQGDLIAE